MPAQKFQLQMKTISYQHSVLMQSVVSIYEQSTYNLI